MSSEKDEIIEEKNESNNAFGSDDFFCGSDPRKTKQFLTIDS
jgi:hypothetical protein